MNRLTRVVREANARGDGVFMPFIVLGDPDLPTSHTVVDALVAGGADVLEFGFPFSDPPADGPVVQAADLRSLAAGTTPSDCFAFIAEVRARHAHPIALLLYYNLILQRGVDAFFAEAAAAGVDGILAADVPLEELGPLVEAGRAHGVANVVIVSELTSDTRLTELAEIGDGFAYVVSRVGITGEQQDVNQGLPAVLSRTRRGLQDAGRDLPALVGFGISGPEQAAAAMAAGADGVICGSAVIRRIVAHADDQETLAATLGDFARAMSEATRGAWRPIQERRCSS